MPRTNPARRAVAITAVVTALVGGSALAGTAAAGATTDPGLQLTAAPTTPACWSPINIGEPGKIYGNNGRYAGEVEQQYNTCDGTVWAHWQWDQSYMTTYHDTVALVVSSPNQSAKNTLVKWPVDTSRKDWLAGGQAHSQADPDTWRAGASWEADDCVSWGTLHWYAGQDLSGPLFTCNDSWYAPN